MLITNELMFFWECNLSPNLYAMTLNDLLERLPVQRLSNRRLKSHFSTYFSAILLRHFRCI